MPSQFSSLTRRYFVQSILGCALVSWSLSAFGQAAATLIPNAEALGNAFTQSGRAIVDYVKTYDELDRKPKLSGNDVKELEAAAARAQAAVASAKRSLQDVIRQLDSSGKWDQADAAVAQNLQKSDLSSEQKRTVENWVKQRGGIKAVAEKASIDFDQAAASIPKEVAALKRKRVSLPFELMSSAYAKPPPWVCTVAMDNAALRALAQCSSCQIINDLLGIVPCKL